MDNPEQIVAELRAIVAELRAMHADMQRLGISTINPHVRDAIKSASLPECLTIVKALAGRVSELTGCAGYLDRAVDEIRCEIESNEPHEARCECDSCCAARSDINYDLWRDKALIGE